MDKVWVIEDPNERLRGRKTTRVPQEVIRSYHKNPAKAYSWSVFFWGGGQVYNHRVVKGLAVFFLIAAFYTATGFTVLSWHDIVRFLQYRGLSVSIFLLIALTLLLCTLIFRAMCCSNAYYRAAKTIDNRFKGTKSRVYPFLCSLLLPGWGQFLNGQPIKGGILAGLSVVSIFSIVTVPVVLLAWKDLEPSSTRFIVESVFTIAFLFLPVIPFVWIFGSYDALKVSLEEWKKEPLLERIKAANNLRSKVRLRSIFRQFKRTVILMLLLGFCLIAVYYYFPWNFYADKLISARLWIRAEGMTLLPDLLGRMFSGVAGAV